MPGEESAASAEARTPPEKGVQHGAEAGRGPAALPAQSCWHTRPTRETQHSPSDRRLPRQRSPPGDTQGPRGGACAAAEGHVDGRWRWDSRRLGWL